jgi:hypothetical protein
MMAYLTRKRFSEGGSTSTILPKPNPLSQKERNQKVFNDYVNRMKHYLKGADMPEWFVKDLVSKKAEELGIELKAEGGVARRKYFAGALGMAPTLGYPAMVGVAKLLGITTAGLGAKELSNVVTQKIDLENYQNQEKHMYPIIKDG